jgi:trk system potassium uptake protein TrkA
MAKQIAVIGLGRFGYSLAVTLSKLNVEVLAVDVEEGPVKAVSNEVTSAVQADATDMSVLMELGMRNFDVVVVGMSGFEASLMTTLHLKELGVNRVVVKAASDVHGKILNQLGADSIVFPEKDMGERVAFSLVSGSVIDHIELADNYTVAEIVIPNRIAGRTLRNLNIRNEYGLTVMAIKRSNKVNVRFSPDEPLLEGDVLVVIGETQGVHRLDAEFEKR